MLKQDSFDLTLCVAHSLCPWAGFVSVHASRCSLSRAYDTNCQSTSICRVKLTPLLPSNPCPVVCSPLAPSALHLVINDCLEFAAADTVEIMSAAAYKDDLSLANPMDPVMREDSASRAAGHIPSKDLVDDKIGDTQCLASAVCRRAIMAVLLVHKD